MFYLSRDNCKPSKIHLCLGLISGTFDDELQAMDFAQAKIHSLVAVAESVGETNLDYADPELLKFREVENRFLRQFNMPEEEKLVNCE